jgi:hypothetical protein
VGSGFDLGTVGKVKCDFLTGVCNAGLATSIRVGAIIDNAALNRVFFCRGLFVPNFVGGDGMRSGYPCACVS